MDGPFFVRGSLIQGNVKVCLLVGALSLVNHRGSQQGYKMCGWVYGCVDGCMDVYLRVDGCVSGCVRGWKSV